MKAIDLLSIPPKDWDLSEFPSLEVDPERIIIKVEQSPFEFYIEGDEVKVSPNFHRWKFSVDNGKSWFVFREFEQMPRSVQEVWKRQTPPNPVVSYETNKETIETTALELWRRWFELSDSDPWEENSYVFCFFCREDMPNHKPDCVFVEAKKLLGLDTTDPFVSYLYSTK